LDPALFRRLVNAAFAQRRKTLVNSLTGSRLMDRAMARSLVRSCHLDPSIRAERLAVTDFIALTRAWQNWN